MPFYEYQCENCGHHEEALQKISDKPLKKCAKCGKNTLKKLMSAPLFRLKGSGWYETDFKSDKDNKRNLAGADKEESKSEAAAETKADAKSDAKPDAKSETKSETKGETPKAEPVKAAPQKETGTASRSARKPASGASARSKPARTAKRTKR